MEIFPNVRFDLDYFVKAAFTDSGGEPFDKVDYKHLKLDFYSESTTQEITL